MGIIETPLAMTPLLGEAEGVGVIEGVDESLDPDADGEAVLTGRLARIAAASLGETVVVLANELAVFESDELEVDVLESDELELDDDSEEPLPLLPLSPFLRTRTETSSTSMSMKVTNGPATIALLSRSITPPFKA